MANNLFENIEKDVLIKNVIDRFDNYLNNKDEDLSIISITDQLREELRFEYPVFNTQTIKDFIRLFKDKTIKELFGDCEDIPKSIMNLTILDKKFRFNHELTKEIYENYGYEENRRIEIFAELMDLIAEISEYSTVKSDYAQKLYNLIRMDFLISSPITTKAKFNKSVERVLGVAGCESGKNKYFKDKAKKLFDKFYVEVTAKKENLYICNTCNYLKSERLSSRLHYFCVNEAVERFNDVHTASSVYYVVKSDVYEYYTQPGLLEKTIYDVLVANGFRVELYPGIEKFGDIKVCVNDKVYFIDAKTTRTNPKSLAEELMKAKYINRLIVLPNRNYKYNKEFLHSNGVSLSIFNVNELLEFLNKQKCEVKCCE